MLALYYLLQLSWGLLQNILGFILWLFISHDECYFYHGAYVKRWHHHSSLALGLFIFYGHHDERILVHEYGHTIQSIILGPFYLLIIGIPSLLWATLPYFKHLRKKKHISYYSLYCERSASKLGRKILGKDAI